MINIEDFQKLEIKIGRVISAERIEGSDKLLKLSVDLGEDGLRQILAGIAEHVADPETLVGKQMPFITNLEPRKMRGELSEGMMLAVSDNGRPVLIHPAEDVSPGSVVQ